MTGHDTSEIEFAIIGGGVVGLASAAELARRGHQVCVLDSGSRFGQGASSHNSGVIHAGIYYPSGSLKAGLCVEGRERLYRFCETHGVGHRRTGKLIVADQPDQTPGLEALARVAAGNGVRVDLLGRGAIVNIEARARGAAALWSPDTGILDVDAYLRALQHDARTHGAILLPSTPLVSAAPRGSQTALVTPRETILASVVVNAAGLFADDVSALLGGEAFRVWACRGDYAELRPSFGPAPRCPIYPTPDPSGHGLGVHVTPTMWGSVLLGPTARYVDKQDYDTGRPDLDFFAKAADRLLGTVALSDIVEGGSGMRAKLHPEEQSFADWVIRHDSVRPGLVQAAGIDSPGLTASLAIAARVATLAAELFR